MTEAKKVQLAYFESVKLFEQTTNHFSKKAKIDQKHLDGDLVERIQADCFRE